MKKTFLVLSILVIIFSGCVRDYHPYAQFTQPYTEYFTGEIVDFTNQSTEATSYLWDFGDGYTTNTFDASHSYSHSGTYTVTLNAYNHNKGSVTTSVIDVYDPSTLNILVMEYGTNFVVPNASVLLFESVNDWDSHDPNKATASGTTNSSGIVVFRNLFPGNYYVDVKSADYDNWRLGNNINNIKTYLAEGVLSKITIDAELLAKKKSAIAPSVIFNREGLIDKQYHHRKSITK